MMIFINTFHQNTFMNQYNRLNHENSKLLSAVYLLSADKRLWDCAWRFVYKNGISFAIPLTDRTKKESHSKPD